MKRSWIAVFSVGLATAWLTCWSLGLTIAGSTLKGDAAQQFSSIGGMQIAFTFLAAIFCLPAISRASISVDARRIALWQLVGLKPSQCARAYYSMYLLVSAISAALGGAISNATWPIFRHLVIRSGFPGAMSLSVHTNMYALVFGPLTSFAILALAGLLMLKAVLHVQPILAVRDYVALPQSRWTLRTILACLGVSGLSTAYWGIGRMRPLRNELDFSGILSSYWGLAFGWLLMYALMDRWAIRIIFYILLRVLPTRVFTSLFSGTASARRRVGLSSAILTPLVVAAGAVGSIYGMIAQAKNMERILLGSGSGADLSVSPPLQVAMIFGAPVVVAIVTTISVVSVTTGIRNRDNMSLLIIGSPRSLVMKSLFWECTVYFVTSVIACYGMLELNSWLMALALRRGPLPGAATVWVGSEPLIVLAIAFTLLALLLFVSSFFGSRRISMRMYRSMG